MKKLVLLLFVFCLGFIKSQGQSLLEDPNVRSIVVELLRCNPNYKITSYCVDTIESNNSVSYQKTLHMEMKNVSVFLTSFPYKNTKNIACCTLDIEIKDSKCPEKSNYKKKFYISKDNSIVVLDNMLSYPPIQDFKLANL